MAYSSHFADTGSKIDLFAGMVLEQIGNSPLITGAWFLASTYPFKSNLPSSRQVCSSSSSSLPSMPNLAHKKASNHRTRHFFPLTIFNTISLGEITTVKSFKEVPCQSVPVSVCGPLPSGLFATACYLIVMPQSITEPHTHLKFVDLHQELSNPLERSFIKISFMLSNNI